jgi:hypothetical protein
VGTKVHITKKESEYESLKRMKQWEEHRNLKAVAPAPKAPADPFKAKKWKLGRNSSTNNLFKREFKYKQTIYMFGKMELLKCTNVHMQHYCPLSWDFRLGKLRARSP